MIFCTRKINKEKVGGHKQTSFSSFKTYSVDKYERVLGKVTFPNYEKYHNINKANNDSFQKLIEMVNNIAPLKTATIKNTSNGWFDKENAEKLRIRDKLFKSSNQAVSTQIGSQITDPYKEARSEVQRTIKQKKKYDLEEKVSENIAKLEQLWETLKSLGPPNKTNPHQIYV